MLNEKVTSSVRPETVLKMPNGECRMRKDITEFETEEGKGFEYNEVFFYTDASVEEIEADFASYWLQGESYDPKVYPEASWEERMEAQLTYTALMTDTLLEEEE